MAHAAGRRLVAHRSTCYQSGMRWISALSLVLLSACDDGGSQPAPPTDAAPTLDGDARSDAALDRGVALDLGLDQSVDAAPPASTDYCEATVDLFCPFYLRCGRMAVPDVDTCRAVFLENCNAVYEPVYVALAEAGLLALDPAAISACADHLSSVECAEQIFDLDGPCGGMWRGQGLTDAPCGPGIESFVCARGNTCVLSLDFCGACEASVAVGADCTEARCGPQARCVDDVCVARALPGAPCGEAGCVLGARCVDDICAGPVRAVVGASCAGGERCPYKSECVGGTCVEAGRIGEPCDARQPCASGACVEGECAAPAAPGSACERGAECVGGICAGTCAAIPGACFDR